MDSIAEYAARHPDKAALIEGDRVMTWAELVDARDRLANALLALGLAPGEHLAIYAANSIENVLAGTAARAIGGITLPINPRLVAEEVAYILDDSDAVAVFVSDQYLPIVEQVRAGRIDRFEHRQHTVRASVGGSASQGPLPRR